MTAHLALLAVATWATVAAGQTADPLSRERLKEMLPSDAVVSELGYQPKWIDRNGPGVYWRKSSPIGVHAPYYALHFTNVHDDSGVAWRFRVQDTHGNDLLSFGPSALPPEGRWTDDLHAERLVFVVEADRKPVGLSFTIDRWLVAHPKPAVRSILVPGDPKIELIAKYRQDAAVWRPGMAVAKLVVLDADRRYSCTGFLIGKDLLLTNEHCVPPSIPLRTPGACSSAITALFDYVAVCGTPTTYACSEVVDKSAPLDYAVLRLAGSPGDSWGVLRLETTRVPKGADDAERLVLIQHPGGRLKSVAIQRCWADRVKVAGVASGGADQPSAQPGATAVGGTAAADHQDFEHVCDTEGGSSGSPVLDGDGRVIGLHHFGFTDGATLRRNQAVLMSRVVANLPPDVIGAFPP